MLRPERWPASRFVLGGYLLLLVAGWAGLRRGLAWAALVALGSSLAAALPLLALAAAVGGFDGWAPTWDTGLLLFLLASAGMALAAGAACTLHLLAAVLLGADRRPRGW